MDFTPYIEYLSHIFSPAQQTALFIITVGVISLTQVFKNIYFGFWPTTRKARVKAILWLAAFSFGAIGGFIGYLIGKPPQPLWFWVFSGTSCGAISILVYKVMVELIWDKLKTRFAKPKND